MWLYLPISLVMRLVANWALTCVNLTYGLASHNIDSLCLHCLSILVIVAIRIPESLDDGANVSESLVLVLEFISVVFTNMECLVHKAVRTMFIA